MNTRSRMVFNSQSGVAMVTVLMVAAVLTVVASAATFGTIREFRSSTEDRRSAQALAFAEAGVDRMMNYLRSGKINWQDIALAGCPAAARYPGETDHPPIRLPGGTEARVAGGSFSVRFEVFNPITTDPARRFAPGACDDPAYPRWWRTPKPPSTFWSGGAQYFAIIATGASAQSATPCPQLAGGACRTVRQVLRVRGVGLPVGIYAKDKADLNGTPSMANLSLITPGSVTGREKLGFTGLDRYYFLSDFDGWGSIPNGSTTYAPAGVHAGQSIALKSVTAANTNEHPNALNPNNPNLNCTANDLRGTAGQSQWDQSGPGYGGDITSGSCASWVSPPGGPPNQPPPTSRIADFTGVAPQPNLTPEDYAALKSTAQAEGLYCFVGGTSFCRRGGQVWDFNTSAGVVSDGDLVGLPNVFVAYFEYQTAATLNNIKWKANWGPCSDDASVNKQVVIIVRKGNLTMTSNDVVHGAVVVPDEAPAGVLDEAGTATIDGTIIARVFNQRGTGRFSVSECAVRNLPIPWIDFIPFNWVEVDR
ncbi:MAG TPA: pilus assembly PilX N-terminal domain-containing protein [Actinomycetota bacterium]|nr:pilus assembly PilX N-terminal domain-containing protein [Actinomycetota bacterium]